MIEDGITEIEWDDIEGCFVDDEGNCYKTNHTLSTPPKKLNVKTPSNPRDFFLMDMFPFSFNKNLNPDTIEKGYALVKPYHHNGNLRIKYDIKRWDTRETFNDKIQKEIQKVLNPSNH